MSKHEKCDCCGENRHKIRTVLRSVIHEHNSARGIIKKFYLVCNVMDIKTNEQVNACHDCKLKLTTNMSAGGNIE